MDSLDAEDGDDGFGPGSDLVMSFLGVVLLLIGVTVVTGLPSGETPVAKAAESQAPQGQTVADAQFHAAAAERDRLRSMIKALQRDQLGLRRRAEQAEQALKDTANRLKQAQARAQAAGTATDRDRPQVSKRCESLLKRSSAGDAMTPAEQTEMRRCI